MDEEYRRVSGDVLCQACGLPYREHPLEIKYDSFDGQELYLNRLCNGALMKL